MRFPTEEELYRAEERLLENFRAPGVVKGVLEGYEMFAEDYNGTVTLYMVNKKDTTDVRELGKLL